ncbi:amidohydrolase family protein [Maribacter sp. 2304DJ31-5]|uniref:amidohydrolase family protein n=1 Tax=Maribacter sp. 2304DJ31-5 TaxID=3386273 RepID=UPI0039BD6908
MKHFLIMLSLSLMLFTACKEKAIKSNDGAIEQPIISADTIKAIDTSRKIVPPTEEEMKAMIKQSMLRIHKSAGRVVAKTIFKNVTIVNAKKEALRHNMAIVVETERIQDIVQVSKLSEKYLAEATIVDLKGAYVIPGLIDSHVHYTTAYSKNTHEANNHAKLNRQIYSGITGVRDMWGDGRAAAQLARETYMNEINAPDFFFSAMMSGPSMFQQSGNAYDNEFSFAGYGSKRGKSPWAQKITAETNIPLAVAMAKGTGATGIKLYEDFTKELANAIIKEAKKQGIATWCHSQLYPASPFDVLEATTVSHIGNIARFFVAKNKEELLHDDPSNYDNVDITSLPEFKKYVKSAVKANTIVEPTICLYTMKDSLNEYGYPPTFRGTSPTKEIGSKMVAALHDAGVPIVAGTDKFAKANEQFPMLFSELESFVKLSKMTPGEAIISATINAAKSLKKQDEFGSIEVGKYANLMFTEKNPLEDIENLKTVVLTTKRGKQFYRKDYTHQFKTNNFN